MAAGRKRTFDKEKALSRAMEVFWLKGYNGASLSDLTEAMGINKPSLYAAYGNKGELFVSAINQYVSDYGLPHFDKLIKQGTSLKDRVQSYLESISMMLTDSKLPGGCFVASSTCEVGSKCLPTEAIRAVIEVNAESTKAFISFFETEQAKGNLPQDSSPQVLADYLLTTQFGLAVMARDGIKRERLESVIKHVVSRF